MATKVNPTPTLSGEDAIRFVEKMKEFSTPEEIEFLKRAEKTYEKISRKTHF